MKRRTKWWVLIGLIILAVGAISLRIYINSKRQWDDPYPPKDDDLLLEWPDIPDDENAYSYLEELDDKIIPMTMPEHERIHRMLKGEEEWDHEYLEKLVARNREAFEIANRMIKCDVFQPPKPDPMSFTFPPLNPIREVAHQWYQQSSSLLEQGKDKEAFDIAIKILRLGDLLEGTQGTITIHMSGAAIKKMGFGIFRQGALRSTLSREEWMKYIEELKEYGPNEEGIAKGLKTEYMFTTAVIDEILAGKSDLRVYGDRYGLYPKHLKPGRLFQPNKTRKMLAETFRRLISNSQKALIDMDIPNDIPDDIPFPGNEPLAYAIPFGKNKVGRMIHDFHTPVLYHAVQFKCRENVEVGLTRLLLALKCYKLDYGDLPETLDQLVPEYIDKIPIDDFDGKPLRYSKDRKIIYSVGRDMKDGGGPTLKKIRELDKPNVFFPIADDPWILIGF